LPGEGLTWLRLDTWLWHARLAKTRAGCARLIEAGGFRLNRQPVSKTHARIRPGDVLTFAWGDEVRVWRVLALGTRRGPAEEAGRLYESLAAGES
jgi:ribosome-associated heat shock protein Hsp15